MFATAFRLHPAQRTNAANEPRFAPAPLRSFHVEYQLDGGPAASITVIARRYTTALDHIADQFDDLAGIKGRSL